MSRWFITLSFTTFMLASISVQSADICKQQDRVCAEQNNSGDCIRYENTFICYTDREDKGRWMQERPRSRGVRSSLRRAQVRKTTSASKSRLKLCA